MLTGTGTLTLILILSSLIIHDAVASCKNTPQSLRDSSPILGEQSCLQTVTFKISPIF